MGMIAATRGMSLAAIVVCCLSGCSATDEPDAETASGPPRTIVLVSIDTLRPDHLGHHGYPRFTSPILDALARQGTVFVDASSPAPWTLPGHGAMLTGRNPREAGVTTYETGLPEGIPTLAALLGQAGYRTGAVVSSIWLKRDTYGLTREFDAYHYVEIPPERRAPSTLVTDQAIEWLREWKGDPTFLFVHYYDVHSDYASQPEYERLFVGPYTGPADGTGVQLLRANFEDAYLELCHERFDEKACVLTGGASQIVVDESVTKMHFDEADVDHLIDLYDAGIRQMDAEIGRFLAYLDESGLASETLLIVTSDHGEEFGEHGRFDHFLTTYEESLRVPLLVRGPGVPAGLRVEKPVSTIDLAPTILGVAGVPQPEGMSGLDLAPLWRGEEDTGFDQRLLHGEASGGLTTRDLVAGIFPVYESVRRGRYKLVHEANADRFALYDLEVDPGEENDVSEALPDVTSALRAVLRDRAAHFDAQDPAGPAVKLSEEELEQLRALGYVP